MEEKNPTILFVDDEPAILKSLRRLFMEEDWNMLFANGGDEGLKVLAEESVDLVVSDVRMPEMDGIAFLREVKHQYPETVRLFLSGYSDQGPVAEALAQGSAQQILAKPWNDDELKTVIYEALKQSRQQKQQSATLQTLINDLPHLPSFPESYQTVSKTLAKNDEFSIDLIEQIAERDVALSTALLHWANSSLFGHRGKVDSVKRAIILLGTDIVESLFLSKAIDDAIGDKARQLKEFNNQEFQQHSMGCALVARWLAKSQYPDDEKIADQAFIAGLLHDIGAFVDAGFFPAEFVKALELANKDQLMLAEAEEKVMLTSHMVLGSTLAEWWSLPSFIVNAIRWHLEPQAAPADQELVELVYLANILCCQFDLSFSGNNRIPDVDEKIWERFNLTPEDLEQLKTKVEEDLISFN